jgi:hypothetical protein
MKARYAGSTIPDIRKLDIHGSLPEIMRMNADFITKNGSYILFKSHDGTWKPSRSKKYIPTRYEKRCIKEHSATL